MKLVNLKIQQTRLTEQMVVADGPVAKPELRDPRLAPRCEVTAFAAALDACRQQHFLSRDPDRMALVLSSVGGATGWRVIQLSRERQVV